MFIPKQFELISQTIKVEEVENLVAENNAMGLTLLNQNKILLQKSTKAFPIPKDQQYKTFFHELSHCLVGAAQFHHLNDTEKEVFIDLLGDLLYQFEKTKVK